MIYTYVIKKTSMKYKINLLCSEDDENVPDNDDDDDDCFLCDDQQLQWWCHYDDVTMMMMADGRWWWMTKIKIKNSYGSKEVTSCCILVMPLLIGWWWSRAVTELCCESYLPSVFLKTEAAPSLVGLNRSGWSQTSQMTRPQVLIIISERRNLKLMYPLYRCCRQVLMMSFGTVAVSSLSSHVTYLIRKKIPEQTSACYEVTEIKFVVFPPSLWVFSVFSRPPGATTLFLLVLNDIRGCRPPQWQLLVLQQLILTAHFWDSRYMMPYCATTFLQ